MGLCAGYERGAWRSEQFAEYLIEWLLDFVYSEQEQDELDSMSARRALRRAASLLYQTDKYARRGEFGELLLHVVLREYFGTLPVIRKIYFKDSPNDTVKGFDAVHVVATDSDLELWLGEVKFYTALGAAIRDAAEEIRRHSQTDYLRTEFSLIVNKLDAAFPHFDKLRKLLDPATSLDEVFTRARVPVLLTYDSDATAAHSSLSEEYLSLVREEILAGHNSFAGQQLPLELVITLILVPLATKELLVTALHTKLTGLQQ